MEATYLNTLQAATKKTIQMRALEKVCFRKMCLILGKHFHKQLFVFCVHIRTLSDFNLFSGPEENQRKKFETYLALNIIGSCNL